MALVARSPVKLAVTPTSGPNEAMIASLQTHIDELVQKNRTCEHEKKKLQQALEREKERGEDLARRTDALVQQDRKSWGEVYESLMAGHRLVHLTTQIELTKANEELVKQREDSRKERVAIVQRDFKLTLFQARASEYERQIAELQEMLDEVAEQHERDATHYVHQYEEKVTNLSLQLSSTDTQRKDGLAKIQNLEAEIATLRADLSNVRKEYAALSATRDSSASKMERITLQLDGAKSALAELENTNAELKRINADLKRQTDKWQNLETKSGVEVEESRKRKIELEVQVKELQVRIKELEKGEKENAKALEKEAKRAERYKKEADRLSEVAHEAQELAEEAQKEASATRGELTDALSRIEELQASASVEQPVETRPNKRKPPAKKPQPIPDEVRSSSETVDDHVPTSEREVEVTVTPKPTTRRLASPDDEDEIVVVAGPSKPRAKKLAAADESDDSTPKIKRKSKSKEPPKKERPAAKKKRSREEEEEEEDSEVQEVKVRPKPASKAKAGAKDKGKGKEVERRSVVEDSEVEEVSSQPKPKKKKLFPTSQAMSFNWGELPKVAGGLEIPTELSPVKDSQAVPPRLIFGPARLRP